MVRRGGTRKIIDRVLRANSDAINEAEVVSYRELVKSIPADQLDQMVFFHCLVPIYRRNYPVSAWFKRSDVPIGVAKLEDYRIWRANQDLANLIEEEWNYPPKKKYNANKTYKSLGGRKEGATLP